MFHGELEYLYDSKSPLNSLSSKALRKIKEKNFTPPKNVYFCVLGESIQRNLKKYVSNNFYQKTISFEHSYIFRKKVKSKKNNDGFLRIGNIGEIRSEKLFIDNLIKFSKLLESIKKIKFYSIGRIFYNKDLLEKNGIKTIPDSHVRRLSRSEMNNYMSMLDYVIFLYPKDGYILRASGAIFDAIDNEKPILAIKNEYFNYLFSKYQEIGYLFENTEGIFEYLNNINQQNTSTDYKKIKHQLSPEIIALHFKKELEKIKFL